jgi:hypothetical protein
VTAAMTSHYTRRDQAQQHRIQTTLGLYWQFQSSEMLTSRNKAEKILSENAMRKQPSTVWQLYETLEPEEYSYVSDVFHFFEQMAVLHQLGYLDEKIVEATLSKYFHYWYEKHFEAILSRSAQARESLHVAEPINYLARNLKPIRI